MEENHINIVLKVLKEKSWHFGTNRLQTHRQHLTYLLPIELQHIVYEYSI
jgi:hypothetical protein